MNLPCHGHNCYSREGQPFIYSRSDTPEFCTKLDRTLNLCPQCQVSPKQAEIWLESLVNYNGTAMDLPECWIPICEQFEKKPEPGLRLYRGLRFQTEDDLEAFPKEMEFQKISYWSTKLEIAQSFCNGKFNLILEMILASSDQVVIDTRNWKLSKRQYESMLILKPGRYQYKILHTL